MNNVYDYLRWRGDLSLAERPFNEVDNLLLSLLSYIDLKGIVPAPGEGSVSLAEAAERYFAERGAPVETEGHNADTAVEWPWMFHLMSQTARFSGMRLSCMADILDASADKQFSALTIEHEPGQLYVAFRGTSDDLAGWKEDFLLACEPEIPSHEEALRYLAAVAALYPEHTLMVGGHSKGGNLAVYAAVMADDAVKARIRTIWNNDGPGFQDAFVHSGPYMAMEGRICKIVPRSSLVGLLLSQRKPDLIVDSFQTGMLQHDGISWEVSRDRFTHLPELSPESLRVQAQIHDWLDHLDIATRRRFVDALFDTLSASGAETVSDIMSGALKALSASGNALKAMDKDMRDRVVDFIRLLIQVWSEMESESRREQTQKALGAFTQSLQYFQKNLVMPGLQKLQQNAGTRRGLLLKKAGKAGDVEPDAGTDAPDGQKA